jgi:subtilisin family serine protease
MRSIVVTAVLLSLAACQDPTSFSSSRSDSVATFAQSKIKEPVPGQYIVVFRNDVVDVESAAKSLAVKHSGKLKHTYKAALKGMAIQLPLAAVDVLRRDPSVAYVEEDQVVHTDAADPIVQPGATDGLDRIDQRLLPLDGTYSYSSDGAGVRVYIIDTGIHYGHNEFAGGRAGFGFDVLGADGDDCNGHGTHVAGTVGGSTYGVAKKVKLYSVRIFDCSGSGAWSDVIAGIDWVTANRVLPAVANMSLGGGFSAAANQAVANSIAAGVVYAIAAGNSNLDACSRSPASTPNAITVAASDVGDQFASFSNFGSCVDVTAPGVNITSAWIGGATATNTISGTSMATPHVAGVAALFLTTNTNATPAQVTTAILNNASAGTLTSVPSGTPNLLLYSKLATSSSWVVRGALPSARRGFAMAATNGSLYAIGGSNSANAVLKTVQAYSPSTNSWTTKASLPAVRQAGNGAVAINGIIYLPGGHDATNALTKTLYAYNSSTNSWSSKTPLPVFGSCGGSAVIAGKIYVFSGCTRSGTGAQVPAAFLHRYDPSTNTWTALHPAPASHFQPFVGAIAGKLYVVGGNTASNTATGRLDVYDPATNSWTTRAPMPTVRVAASGSAIGGKLVVIGGRNGTTYLSTVEAYDPVANSWSSRSSMPTARAAFGVGGLSGLLYAIGGRNSSTTLATNERFTP